jgi:hypothetical protein
MPADASCACGRFFSKNFLIFFPHSILRAGNLSSSFEMGQDVYQEKWRPRRNDSAQSAGECRQF